MNETVVMQPVTHIAVYNEFRNQIAQLKSDNEKLVFDYEDPKGNKEARSHIYKLRQTKAAIDKARKQEKAASLEYGRLVDAEANEILADIELMIYVHAKPLEEIEQREAKRLASIRDRIESMRAPAAGMTSQALRARLIWIKGIAIDDSFGEFLAEAAQVKDAAVTALEATLSEAAKREAEAVELDRLRKESEDRARYDREEKIRRDAEQNIAAAMERKAQAERDAAERRELELKLAAERAERARVEAQQRTAIAAREAEERVRREAEDARRAAAEAQAKREADRNHKAKVNNAAVAALVSAGLKEKDAKTVVSLIAKGQVPAVAISY